ncbi:hypothetical protein KAU32_02335 [bacterium]|nr:hypothetical protein [bacterium]
MEKYEKDEIGKKLDQKEIRSEREDQIVREGSLSGFPVILKELATEESIWYLFLVFSHFPTLNF